MTMKKAMHENSLVAFEDTVDLRGDRLESVYLMLQDRGAMTDRQVMEAMGFTDPNAVRPRITELKDRFWVIEVGRVKDPITGKTVRQVRALGKQERQDLIDERRRKAALDFPKTETQDNFLANLATA